MSPHGRAHRRSDRPPTLAIRDLTITLRGRGREGVAVDGISLEVWPGEIVGLIGESGSGKTMTALAVLGLLPRAARIAHGDIVLSGRSLRGLPDHQLRTLRGSRIAMIPQNPTAALNPVLRVGVQVGEPFVLHRRLPWREALAQAVRRLGDVHLPAPGDRAREYPHQFSGGMQQRAMTAMATALEPELLVADEPTTALDVTIQAQVLRLLREIRDVHGTAILFITHDLGVVAEVCDWVYVMYAGRILETASVVELFARPRHPYTQALLRATPVVESAPTELLAIPGMIPSPFELPQGCRFADRCPLRFPRCDAEPPLLQAEAEHAARCWLVEAAHA
ncbi:MAG: ABC transporter ATP-binding protein [Armatimonadota bacterium]|nr:ABC transporter ATP-binding protein [Armatimonadota bacterium]MDR7486979.1 ABC transporter ATP-binding protein [Armatimonadota bacterium]MDR7532637.1 ABC transporter ATP-binding protein [Armatimonadota bacterium]MDR7536155.1 ABC transporter ATP-binding protein [Armatimonadota bacterium]